MESEFKKNLKKAIGHLQNIQASTFDEKESDDLLKIISVLQSDRWISIRKALPAIGKCVIVYTIEGHICEDSLAAANGFFNTNYHNVIFWMDFPPPPIDLDGFELAT